MSQLDLFSSLPAHAPPPPAPVIAAPPLPIPPRSIAWEKWMAGSSVADRVTVMVSTLWTGEILEVLSDPDLGRRGLTKEGGFWMFPPDSAHGRLVHATPDQARAMHRKRALILTGSPGTHSVRFVFGNTPGTSPLIFPAPFKEFLNAP